MPLSRFCAAAFGALILTCAGTSFATGEDAPLPGDFQPPRQSKAASKPLPPLSSSNKANDAPARNIPPQAEPASQLKATVASSTPRRVSTAKRSSKRHHAAVPANKSRHQARTARTGQRLHKAPSKLQRGTPALRSSKAKRLGKKAAISSRSVGKRAAKRDHKASVSPRQRKPHPLATAPKLGKAKAKSKPAATAARKASRKLPPQRQRRQHG